MTTMTIMNINTLTSDFLVERGFPILKSVKPSVWREMVSTITDDSEKQIDFDKVMSSFIKSLGPILGLLIDERDELDEEKEEEEIAMYNRAIRALWFGDLKTQKKVELLFKKKVVRKPRPSAAVVIDPNVDPKAFFKKKVGPMLKKEAKIWLVKGKAVVLEAKKVEREATKVKKAAEKVIKDAEKVVKAEEREVAKEKKAAEKVIKDAEKLVKAEEREVAKVEREAKKVEREAIKARKLAEREVGDVVDTNVDIEWADQEDEDSDATRPEMPVVEEDSDEGEDSDEDEEDIAAKIMNSYKEVFGGLDEGVDEKEDDDDARIKREEEEAIAEEEERTAEEEDIKRRAARKADEIKKAKAEVGGGRRGNKRGVRKTAVR